MYRGQEGMFAWIIHRVSGLAVLFFLLLHILDTATVLWGPFWYELLPNLVYKQAWFRPFEAALIGAVLYHAINGVRVIIIDFWPGSADYQRQLWWGVVALSAITILPITAIIVAPVVGIHLR
jgi:succinate dehydrogenase / fumarate reductase cytochrome b subunit